MGRLQIALDAPFQRLLSYVAQGAEDVAQGFAHMSGGITRQPSMKRSREEYEEESSAIQMSIAIKSQIIHVTAPE